MPLTMGACKGGFIQAGQRDLPWQPSFIRKNALVIANGQTRLISDFTPHIKGLKQAINTPETLVLLAGDDAWQSIHETNFEPLIPQGLKEGFKVGAAISLFAPSLSDLKQTITQIYAIKSSWKDPGEVLFDTERFSSLKYNQKSSYAFKWRLD